MKLKSILYILMLLPFLWSCNNEDDVEEIFASGTWHVVDFYGKSKLGQTERRAQIQCNGTQSG